ncbi:MAG: PilT protein domain-containing protein [Microgenomates group bacterium Gr01-1014_7]|nr:MAG: PilT protein domain-containing protein [Microgenomates group bacterium Gr01-1014_7]
MAANIKKYIVDASFVLSFLLPDENHQEADLFFNQYKAGIINFLSTPLLPFEVVNGLKLAVIRKRISSKYAKERMKEFFNYQIRLVGTDFFEVFDLAQKNNLTVYDACYLYLSRIKKAQLLTSDEALQKLI